MKNLISATAFTLSLVLTQTLAYAQTAQDLLSLEETQIINPQVVNESGDDTAEKQYILPVLSRSVDNETVENPRIDYGLAFPNSLTENQKRTSCGTGLVLICIVF